MTVGLEAGLGLFPSERHVASALNKKTDCGMITEIRPDAAVINSAVFGHYGVLGCDCRSSTTARLI